MTGFEPATPRPPGVCATGLRYIPNTELQICYFFSQIKEFDDFILGLVDSLGAVIIYIGLEKCQDFIFFLIFHTQQDNLKPSTRLYQSAEQAWRHL